jgi:hypothetical protein
METACWKRKAGRKDRHVVWDAERRSCLEKHEPKGIPGNHLRWGLLKFLRPGDTFVATTPGSAQSVHGWRKTKVRMRPATAVESHGKAFLRHRNGNARLAPQSPHARHHAKRDGAGMASMWALRCHYVVGLFLGL